MRFLRTVVPTLPGRGPGGPLGPLDSFPVEVGSPSHHDAFLLNRPS